jgi:hypothetical protein
MCPVAGVGSLRTSDIYMSHDIIPCILIRRPLGAVAGIYLGTVLPRLYRTIL